MEKRDPVKLVDTIDISAQNSSSLIGWLLYICFAYHYKIILCGLLGTLLGFDWFCQTMIKGVTINHWIEQLIYAPLLWYAFYRVIQITFGPLPDEIIGSSVKKLKTIALFLLAMYIYGIGIHFANTIEIYSRTVLGIESGPLYEQVYWVDEQLSHWIQFFFFFALFSWIIVCDRLDRTHGGHVALFTGLLHGLERAIGVIEGDNPYIAFILGFVILLACLRRWQRHERDFKRVWKDFFFRHGLSFGISMPVALFLYRSVFGEFLQPSSMGKQGWTVLLFVAVVTSIGFTIGVILDRYLIRTGSK